MTSENLPLHGSGCACGPGEDATGAGCGCADSGGARGPLAEAGVRQARVTDAPAVGLVQATVWHEEFTGLLPTEVLEQVTGPRFASLWRESLSSPPSPRHRLLVARAGEQVVGYLAVGPVADLPEGTEPGLEAEVTGIIHEGGVHPAARRAGHGSRLLNAAVDTLRADLPDLAVVATWVPERAARTRTFLEGAGFEPDGAWRERVVAEDGRTLREVRLVTAL